MQPHLNRMTIDQYLARTLNPVRLRAFDAHVTSCPECTLSVESAGLDESRWERRGPLSRLVRVLPRAPEQLHDGACIERAA